MRVFDESDVDLRTLIEKEWPGATVGRSVTELLPAWLTYKKRQISRVGRKVVVSSRVLSVQESFPAIQRIERLLKRGGDLRPYLHKQIYSNPQNEFADPQLLDWGILHFHLGDDNGTRSVTRTGPILFAYIDHTTAYLLDIKPHGGTKEIWVDSDLVRALIEVAPKLAESRRLKDMVGVSTHYTESEKYDLRKVGVNSIVEVDGKYYALFGPGISTANTSVSSRRLVDQYLLEKQILIERIESGALAVRGRVRPPLVETVAVIRADLRGDRLVLYSDSDGQLLLKSPPIS